ncbi:MAG: T9SS type A sorting domain-containing protein, partial [Candidatus Marinimicrobia bacterium]|nr:T9SS type A sorting domain-containing protein [Candidatus Neomarinimicrobiota bacterium]
VITSPLQVNAVEDEYFKYQALGSDPEGATLVWAFDMAANWLTANSDSIFGYPREGDTDTSFRIIASDGNLLDTAFVVLLVEAVNDTPNITSANYIVAIEDDFMVYHAAASDPENSVLNFSFINLPTWLTANSDSVFGIPDYYNNDTSFLVIADDGILADTLQVSVTIQLVNDPPVLILDINAAEKHGDFTFNLQATDEEQPSVSVVFEYSLDNVTWATPAILPTGNDSYSWATETDFPGSFQSQIWLKAIGSDASISTTIVSPAFSIDNHVGSLQIDIDTTTPEFNNVVVVPFVITDITGDSYTLSAAFSVDDGQGWRAATVSGLPTQIDPSNYSGILNWDSDADLPDLYIDAQFALLPSDNWQTGAGDTVQLLIDNQNLVTLTNFSAGHIDAVNWFTEFQLGFDLPVDTTSFNSGIRLIGDNQGNIPLDFNYDSQNQVISISPQEWYHANDTVRLEINDNLLDQTGDPFDGNSNDIADGLADRVEYPLKVNLLADYDASGLVDFSDLVEFKFNWENDAVDIFAELGPAAGLPPDLQIQPDSSFDFEDMMVFVQMWNWSAGFENYNFLARSILNDDVMNIDVFYPGKTQSTDEYYIVLSVKLDSAVAMGAMEIVLSYDPSIISFKEINYRIDQKWLKLFYTDNSGKLKINLADLGDPRSQLVLNPLSIKFNKIVSTKTSVLINSDIRNQSGIPVQIMQKEYYFDTDAPVPTKYALHQNYPNPFNPETTIKYELPLDGSVRLTIHNILGQEVIRLVDGWQSAGYKTVTWNGLNSTGIKVSGGMYFLRMETGSFNAVRKLILLK